MHGFKEKFLRPENENIVWKVNNSITVINPSKQDIKDFITLQSPLRSDVIWFNPEEVTQPKISPIGSAAVSSSPRGSAAVSSSPRGSAAVSSSPRKSAAFSSSRGSAAVLSSRDATVVSS